MVRSGFLLFAFLLVCTVAFSQDVFEGVERIVAVGDVHGGYEELVGILRSAGLIDNKNRWKGGRAHLVQCGDLLDRGPASRKVMDLLMDLEGEAQRAGGRVHALLGNHEVMNIYGDLRYVSRSEFESYRGPNSSELRDQQFESQANPAQRADPNYRRKWEEQHPLGWVEQRLAFSQYGRYGKWLREKNVVVKINNALFLHGGISPKYVSLSIREINERIRAELRSLTQQQGSACLDAKGPIWYRGLAEASPPELAAHVDNVLKTFDVQHMVIAHTPTPGVVMPRFDGKIILIDVGLSRYYGDSPVCVVFDGSKPFALHRGAKLELPVGRDAMAYLKTAAELDPPDSRLRNYVNRALR